MFIWNFLVDCYTAIPLADHIKQTGLFVLGAYVVVGALYSGKTGY